MNAVLNSRLIAFLHCDVVFEHRQCREQVPSLQENRANAHSDSIRPENVLGFGSPERELPEEGLVAHGRNE
jgi:hypothetical protein